MSLILEALRKSEADRRRGETPSVYSELPPAPSRARTRVPATGGWLLIAAAALSVGWIVRAYVERPHDTPRARVRTVSVPSANARAHVWHDAPTALPPVPRLTAQPAVIPAIAKATPPTVEVPRAPPAARAETPPPVPLPSPPSASPPQDDGMRLADLDPEQRKALPPLKLSMHMWNSDPSQRFVILDGNRLREGDRIGDAVVTSITSDGVVLDWNGRKLKLPIR